MRQSTWLGLVGLLLVALGVTLTFMTTQLFMLRALAICAGCGLVALAVLRRLRDGA